MSKKKLIIIILPCAIIVLLLLVFMLNRKYIYPSVIDTSYKEVSGVNTSVDIQISGNEKILVCNLENHNDYEITFGEEYYLEIEKDGKWYEIADRSGKRTKDREWNALAHSIPANEDIQFEIPLSDYRELSDGNYRIVKVVDLPNNIEDGSSTYIIVVPFKVGK